MNFLHRREYLNEGDIVVVQCSHQCNVRVMDDLNYDSFRSGRAHRYHGGFFTRLPARIVVPSTGFWNVTLDLGGGSANIRYSFNFLRRRTVA